MVVKDSPFPGKEPARLFLLRSSTDTVLIKAPKYAGTSGDKWVKTPFEKDDRIPTGPRAAVPSTCVFAELFLIHDF
jgi:hypothetical protein